ncbi:MAG TPA: glycosyltransferase family 2 protein [Gemmatimonadaceae bacterium]|nr:glycosyltransferase family 2 protein [Gemmatimonadaceae bacterium]
MSAVTAALWSLPWVILPIVVLLRARNSRSLDSVSADIVAPAPLVSVIIPARDEQRNIDRCVRSVLSSRYPSLEVIVVDDHSSDGTGDIARAVAANDARLRVIEAPELPTDWFGKQWACATGAAAARSEVLVFTDADTQHADDLIPRVVNAMRERGADLLSIAGEQAMDTFWERIVQPQMFALLTIRYGGTEHVSRATRPEDAIANGQFIAVRREPYDAIGGHAAVRHLVAEDMGLAQEFVRARRRLVLLVGARQLSTRMYTSFRELVDGWRKNIYAGGRNASLGGTFGRTIYPLLLLSIPVLGLLPPIALVLAGVGLLSSAWLFWSAIAVSAALVFWGAIYRFLEQPVAYAALYPLGLAMLAYIGIGAIARGHRVQWKKREYLSR